MAVLISKRETAVCRPRLKETLSAERLRVEDRQLVRRRFS